MSASFYSISAKQYIIKNIFYASFKIFLTLFFTPSSASKISLPSFLARLFNEASFLLILATASSLALFFRKVPLALVNVTFVLPQTTQEPNNIRRSSSQSSFSWVSVCALHFKQ